jgi:hypothetical protein
VTGPATPRQSAGRETGHARRSYFDMPLPLELLPEVPTLGLVLPEVLLPEDPTLGELLPA